MKLPRIVKELFKKHYSVILTRHMEEPNTQIFGDRDFFVDDTLRPFPDSSGSLIHTIFQKYPQTRGINVSTRKPRVKWRVDMTLTLSGTSQAGLFACYEVESIIAKRRILLCMDTLQEIFHDIPKKLYVTI